jgi:hypothetical protein
MGAGTWQTWTLAALLVAGCAHSVKVTQGPGALSRDAVLAQTIAWVVNAAPSAERYIVQVEGHPPTTAVLADAARAVEMSRAGAELKPRNDTAVQARVVSIDASTPSTASPIEAVVEVSYRVDEGPAVPCTVRVRLEGKDWLLNSPSGVECWPRPRRGVR